MGVGPGGIGVGRSGMSTGGGRRIAGSVGAAAPARQRRSRGPMIGLARRDRPSITPPSRPGRRRPPIRRTDAEDRVRAVLEPNERIVWVGQPHVDAAVPEGSSGPALRLLLSLGVTGAVAYVAVRALGSEGPLDPGVLLESRPFVLWALVAVVLLPLGLRAVGLDGRSRLRRYFEGLAYGITDRRVLVLDGNDVLAFTADTLSSPTVVPRAHGYADVIFAHNRETGDGGRDPVRRERARVGFKSIPDAERLRSTLEAWVEAHRRRVADEVGDFVASGASSRPAEGSFASGTASVRHPESGLTVHYPEAWGRVGPSQEEALRQRPFSTPRRGCHRPRRPGGTSSGSRARAAAPSRSRSSKPRRSRTSTA